MQTHPKTLRLLALSVPFAEVSYIMDKSAAAQCSINMGTSLLCSLVKPECGPEAGALDPTTEAKIIWISSELFI